MNEYEQIVRESAKRTMQMEAEWEVISIVLAVLAALMVAATLYLLWCAHRDHKARRRGVWGEFRPTVTQETQVMNGVEFRRMGIPERR